MRRALTTLLAVSPLLAASTVSAQRRPNYDAFAEAPAVSALHLRNAQAPLAVVHLDTQRQVPTLLLSERGAPAASDQPGIAAREHFGRHASRYGLSNEAVSGIEVGSESTLVVEQTTSYGNADVDFLVTEGGSGDIRDSTTFGSSVASPSSWMRKVARTSRAC